MLVDFVRAVECDVEECGGGEAGEGDVLQPRAVDHLPGLVACGDEEDGGCGGAPAAGGRGGCGWCWGGGREDRFDGFDDVDDCAAGADPDVAEGGVEVVCYGADGGGAFGGFDWVEGGLRGHARAVVGAMEREDVARLWFVDWKAKFCGSEMVEKESLKGGCARGTGETSI